MKPITNYVGLDVHKSTISVAVAEGERDGEVRHHGVVENRAEVLVKLAERLGRRGARLRFCYEAGPCGLRSLSAANQAWATTVWWSPPR